MDLTTISFVGSVRGADYFLVVQKRSKLKQLTRHNLMNLKIIIYRSNILGQ